MLVEIAIADAYGSGFEFSSSDKVQKYNNLENYMPHDLYHMSAKYTDDAQMSIAIAELLISGAEWSNINIASQFVQCFKRDPRRGYSKGFYELLSDVKDGAELLARLKNTSDRNGSAMRSVPLGVLKNKQELLYKATTQAMITHNTKVGIDASCAVALAAHFGLHHQGQLVELQAFLASESLSGWDYQWHGEVSVNAFDTVSAAFTALISCRSLDELLFQCINFGGDTDSVASIAVGLATCFREYDKSLAPQLVERLDEPVYGIRYLRELDQKLQDLGSNNT